MSSVREWMGGVKERARRAAWAGALLASLGAAPAFAQGPAAMCRAEMSAAATARLLLCEQHAGCRAVVRIIDSCAALQVFVELLGNHAAEGVDDTVLLRTLVDAGVPATGLASCTSHFNRALCRNFLNLENPSGETASGPTRSAQFQLSLRRLVEQQERARIPADAFRTADQKLEACGAARPGPERDAPCREALEAVRACEFFRDNWYQRREVLQIDAQRLGQAEALQTLRSLELPACPQTVPGTTLTPQQALISAAADVPAPGAQDTRPPIERVVQTAGTPPAVVVSPPVPASAPPAPPAALAAAAHASPAARADAGAPGECRAALRRMEERFEAIQRRRPAQPDRLASQQVEIYMLTEQMGLLERLCRGEREYDFLRPTQERLARTLAACRGSTPNPVNDCVPRVAW
ncbi:MAG: hypothetical protein KIT17_11810 [Rubrivivax sp.]|nr:hypothetical protein [Rubrivivax sp.]